MAINFYKNNILVVKFLLNLLNRNNLGYKLWLMSMLYKNVKFYINFN